MGAVSLSRWPRSAVNRDKIGAGRLEAPRQLGRRLRRLQQPDLARADEAGGLGRGAHRGDAPLEQRPLLAIEQIRAEAAFSRLRQWAADNMLEVCEALA